MILGLHCGVRNGYLAALRRAQSLGCEALQMFSYRRHHEPAEEELRDFRAAFAASGLRRLIIHVRYLPFLASEDADWRRGSVRLLARELRLARGLGAHGLILHLGAYSPGSDLQGGLRRFSEGVREALDAAPAPLVMVENVPGGGRRMGGPLEELARVLELLGSKGVPAGVCLDTAHAWAQGCDLSTREGMWSFLGRAHRLLGDRVAAFHLNDSRALLGSFREHHWHWGRGYLGGEGLAALIERKEYRDAVGILETPPGELDAENLAFVRRLMRPT